MTETHRFTVALRGENRDVYEHTVKKKAIYGFIPLSSAINVKVIKCYVCDHDWQNTEQSKRLIEWTKAHYIIFNTATFYIITAA